MKRFTSWPLECDINSSTSKRAFTKVANKVKSDIVIVNELRKRIREHDFSAESAFFRTSPWSGLLIGFSLPFTAGSLLCMLISCHFETIDKGQEAEGEIYGYISFMYPMMGLAAIVVNIFALVVVS